jgi:hypothetical protein
MTTPNLYDAVEGLKASLKAFAASHQDLKVQMTHTDDDGLFRGLSEALWWATSVDEGFYDVLDQPYRDDRDVDANGKVVFGLVYARDRCGHQRALVTRRTGGISFPISFPLAYKPLEFLWRPADELPEHEKRPGRERGRPEYELYLEGKPAAEALESAALWFATARVGAGV